MIETILVTGAGSGGAENLIRSIRDINRHISIIGTNSKCLLLANSVADIKHSIVHSSDVAYSRIMGELINKYDVDLIIPNNDKEVRAISTFRDDMNCNVFLPDHQNIIDCQDKLSLSKKIPEFMPKTVEFIEAMDFEDKWIKLRRGSGSMASLPIDSVSEAISWVDWWIHHRDLRPQDFLICDRLPGRDYAVQSIWKDGTCIQIKVVQRIEYIFGKNMPQGSSSSPAVAIQVYNPQVIDLCLKAVKSINKNANGIWSIDLKEDKYGDPKINEINIGRFCMISPIFNHGNYSMTATYLRCTSGQKVMPEFSLGRDVVDVIMVRELDTLPYFLFPENAQKMVAEVYGTKLVYGIKGEKI